MNLRLGTLVTAAIGAIASFLIVATLMQPGLLDMTTPIHSDFYRYFLLSEKRWLPSDWLAPRPLMLAYLKLVGVVHKTELVFVLLAVPAMMFVSLIPFITNHVGLTRSRVLPWAAFFVVTFGSPYFYQIYQFDYGGMLSGMFASLAVFLGIVALTKNGPHTRYMLSALALALASVESKPTYAIALLYLAFVGVLLFKDRKSIQMVSGVALILLWVFLKDKVLGSPFVADASASSPYAVVINPMQNISVLAFYITHAFTGPLMLVAALSLLTLAAIKEWKLLAITLGLCITASAPMALLVNRQWESYAWYSTVVIALLVLYAVDRVLRMSLEAEHPRVRVAAKLALVLLMLGVCAHALARHPSVDWTLENQSYNRNVLQALALIDSPTDGRKLLMAGIKGPYHPFKNTAYVSKQYPRIGQFDTLLRRAEEPWNRMSNEQTNGVYLDQVEMDNYSLAIVFGHDGRIVQKITSLNLKQMSSNDRDSLLVCGRTVGNDPTAVAQLIECMNHAGEFKRAIEVGQATLGLAEKQYWIYYHLSMSYLGAGNPHDAFKLANKALVAEPGNEVFQRAVKAAKAKIE